ncbi:hypothetical protein I6E81_07580 [Salinibacterium sp. NG22]|uniref:hypothetical protein n=1 Tax=unclassified Salinibacterium TaxID=2632331 RepID=UPI0018CCE4D4|nr:MULTISPECIES: hypothetical protein [unclassified Salinibacterium]MBH0110025.1 hypothetical protein [Salinibacterium sp. NG22]MBH0130306.1 hypothetical protein [Salinibacterium sp. NK8237]
MAQVFRRAKSTHVLVAAAGLLLTLAVVLFGPYFLRHGAATAECGQQLGGAAGGGGSYSVAWMPVPVPGWECSFRPGGAANDTVEFLPWWT